LLLAETEDAPALPADLSHRLQEAFARGHGHGLLQLGAAEVGTVLPPVLGYWRELGGRYVTTVCARPDLDGGPRARAHSTAVDQRVGSARLGRAADDGRYLTASVLQALWDALDMTFRSEVAESKTSIHDFLRHKSLAWKLIGRVHFNLAEHRKDDEAPFAFLVTYTTRLSAPNTSQRCSTSFRSFDRVGQGRVVNGRHERGNTPLCGEPLAWPSALGTVGPRSRCFRLRSPLATSLSRCPSKQTRAKRPLDESRNVYVDIERWPGQGVSCWRDADRFER
jgi:hypothetical protein